MITLSICLSDLPKEKIQTASNGKKYINLVVDRLKRQENTEKHTRYTFLKVKRSGKQKRIKNMLVLARSMCIMGNRITLPKHPNIRRKNRNKVMTDCLFNHDAYGIRTVKA